VGVAPDVSVLHAHIVWSNHGFNLAIIITHVILEEHTRVNTCVSILVALLDAGTSQSDNYPHH
jgi:hypothetical protein